MHICTTVQENCFILDIGLYKLHSPHDSSRGGNRLEDKGFARKKEPKNIHPYAYAVSHGRKEGVHEGVLYWIMWNFFSTVQSCCLMSTNLRQLHHLEVISA